MREFEIKNGILEKYNGIRSDVIIPEGVTEIGRRAFESCHRITSITIPESVTSIGRMAFCECTGLTNVTIPDSVTNIYDWAFALCKNLKVLTIGSGVSFIGSKAFYICPSLVSIKVAADNRFFHSSANCLIHTYNKRLIAGCKNSIIPDDGTVTSIECDLFVNCDFPSAIIIPESVESIGEYAFDSCTGLIVFKGTLIPKNIWFLSYNRKPQCIIYCPYVSFSDIPSRLKLPAALGFLEARDDSLTEEGQKKYMNYLRRQRKMFYPLFSKRPEIQRFFIENRFIPLEEAEQLMESTDDAESKAIFLEYVNSFPNTEREKIEKKEQDDLEKALGFRPYTAADYRKMFTIHPDGDCFDIVRYKGNDSSVMIPEFIGRKHIRSIREGAFKNCAEVSAVILPDNIKYIGSDVFKGTAYYEDESNWEDDVLYNNNYLIEARKSIEGCCSIRPGTVLISDKAFLGCKKLTGAVIPGSVSGIANWAFYKCKSLTNVSIGNGVGYIDYAAFYGCESLTSLNIPDSVTHIDERVFNYCCGLESISVSGKNEAYHSSGNCLIETETKALMYGCGSSIIPDDGTVTSIVPYAFEGCKKLVSITIPDSVTSIGREAFSNCSCLKSVIIGNGVRVIQPYTFEKCSDLKDVSIGNRVNFIKTGAFYKCSNLETLIIPDSVREMYYSVFNECNSLKKITIGKGATRISSAFRQCSALIIFKGTIIPRYEWFEYYSFEKRNHCVDCRIYCPYVSLSLLQPKLKPAAVLGFIEARDDSMTEERQNEYLDYLRRNRNKYYPMFNDDPRVFSLFIEKKLIPLNEAKQLLTSLNDNEKNVVLIDYINSYAV